MSERGRPDADGFGSDGGGVVLRKLGGLIDYGFASGYETLPHVTKLGEGAPLSGHWC